MDTVVLLHGFPHTPRVWDAVRPGLERTRRVVAPDLLAGADGLTLAGRVADHLDELGITSADVVGIDAGGPVALLLALSRPEQVRRLVVVEAVLGRLPGGPVERPWWFGFHQVPGLAETVLAGHEAAYADFFLRAGGAVPPEIRDAFLAAYGAPGALGAALEHYRAMPATADQIDRLAVDRLRVPVLAVGARPVGAATARQLAGIASDLTVAQLDCGHIVPLDAPADFLAVLLPFLDR